MTAAATKGILNGEDMTRHGKTHKFCKECRFESMEIG